MRQSQQGLYLRSVKLLRETVPSFDSYPFDLSAIRSLDELEFHPKVTYIVGENGMGKSTLMEAIAIGLGFNPEGGTINFNFSTEATHSELHQHLRLVRSVNKPRDGFFFERRAIIIWRLILTKWTVSLAVDHALLIHMAESRSISNRMVNPFLQRSSTALTVMVCI